MSETEGNLAILREVPLVRHSGCVEKARKGNLPPVNQRDHQITANARMFHKALLQRVQRNLVANPHLHEIARAIARKCRLPNSTQACRPCGIRDTVDGISGAIIPTGMLAPQLPNALDAGRNRRK